MIALLVAVGAVLGAPARYMAEVVISRRARSFPYGTVIVNVAGSFVLGLVTGLGLHHGLSGHWLALVGTGFCGAFTTYSTYSYETVALLCDGRPVAAAANLVGSVGLGLLAAAAGLGLALA